MHPRYFSYFVRVRLKITFLSYLFVLVINCFAQVSSEDLILYLDFDNSVIEDKSGLGHSVVNNGADLDQGIEGQGLYLNGNNAYLSVESNANLLVPDQVTCSIWYRHEQQNDPLSFYSLIEQSADESGGHSRYGTWLRGNSFWGCIEPDDCPDGRQLCQRCIDIPVNLIEGQWHHLAFSYDNSTMKLFIDGELVSENTFSPPTGISTRNYPMTIGTDVYDPNPVFLNGIIDEIRVYKRALSDNEIEQLAAEFMTTNTLSISELSFSLYPNPSDGVIRFDIDHIEGINVVVYDVHARQVSKLTYDDHIDLSFLDKGIYFLRFNILEKLYTTKVFID